MLVLAEEDLLVEGVERDSLAGAVDRVPVEWLRRQRGDLLERCPQAPEDLQGLARPLLGVAELGPQHGREVAVGVALGAGHRGRGQAL